MPMYARFVGAAPIRAGSHKEAIQQERLFSGGECAVFVDGAPAGVAPVQDLISAVRAGRDVSGRIKANAGVEEVSFILVDEADPELRELLDEQEIR
jgi:hypothetical protein